MIVGDILTIKNIPSELKSYWSDEAKRNFRSMDSEIIRVLEDERRRRAPPALPKKDFAEIMEAVRRVQSHPIIDHCPIDAILYDDDGLPK
jgi:hypothetical protein